MNWENGLAWLAARARVRRAPRTGSPDHGDVGTAFGLDASFDAAPEPTPVPPAPAGRWDHRLIRRTKL